MDDMNALERQLASVVRGAMRPPRPVDGSAIVRSVTSEAPTDPWSVIRRRLRGGSPALPEGGFSMFSAVKIVAAAAIVALFGGLLLTGVLTAPEGEERAPAAATSSPAADPSSGITFVPTDDPNVFEVISEPHKKWLGGKPFGLGPIAIDPGGGVWVQGWDGAKNPERAFLAELGVPGRVKLEPFQVDDLAFTADGTLWAPSPRREPRNPRQLQPVLRSFDGERWTRHDTGGFTVFSASCTPSDTCDAVVDLFRGADGTVYGLQGIGGKADAKEDADPATDVVRQIAVSTADGEGLVERYLDWPPGRLWAGTCDGDGAGPPSGIPEAVAATPDGDIWVAGRCGLGWGIFARGAHGWLLRYQDGTPEVVRPLGEDVDPGVGDIAVGPEGDVWAVMRTDSDSYLGQFDGSEWTMHAFADGLLPGGRGMAVGADGRVWYTAVEVAAEDRVPAGLAAFDGQTTGRYFQDADISDIAIAADGSVWVTANSIGGDDGPSGIFVIRPEGTVPE